jgi:flagellar basal body-associated protein FliL
MDQKTLFTIAGDVEIPEKYPKNKGLSVFVIIISIVLILVLAVTVMYFLNKKKPVSPQNMAYQDTVGEVYQLKEQNDSLLKLIRELRGQLGTLASQSAAPQGIFYEIQIGTFQTFNLNEYLNELAELRQETFDGKNKYLLGRFTDYDKALRFENDLKRMGFRDAFIAGRIDGKLVDKEVALDYQRKLTEKTE